MKSLTMPRTPASISWEVFVATGLWVAGLFGASAQVPTEPVKDHLQLWLKADAGVTTNASGGVTGWADQSGQNNNAAQSDDTMAPQWVAGALNGKPALRFDGTQDYLEVADAPSLEIVGDLSTFAVVNFTDYANYREIWGKTAGAGGNLPAPTDWYLVQATGVSRVYRGDGTATGLGSVDSNRPLRAGDYLVLGFEMEGTTLTQYANGFPIGSGTITAPLADGGTALRIGSREDLFTKMKGDIAELLIYDSALAEADRNKVFDYLKNKYGLLNLPPSVSVTAPKNNATVAAPTTITVTADASDGDGKIAKVDFYGNGSLIATATAKPYSVPVAIKTAGTLILTAIATDDKDATTTSAAIKVTVTGAGTTNYTAPASLKLWLKADAGVTTNASGGVTAWADQTANKNDAAQSTDTAAPQWVDAAANGKPVVRFDGTSRYLDVPSSASLSITGDIASFFVVKFDDFATFRAVWGKTASNLPRPTDYYVVPGSGVARLYRGGDAGNASVDSAGAFGTGQYLIAGFSQTSNAVTHFLNGSPFGTGSIALELTDAGTELRIGSRDDLATQMKGDIAELMVFDAGVSGINQTDLASYLASKYGVILLQSANQPPAVSLTNVIDGTTLAAPASVNLAAVASDKDGSVVKVDLYANGSLLSSLTNTPYQMSALVETPGRVTLTAVATDNLGSTATSAPVSLVATGAVSTFTATAALQVWLEADKGVTLDASNAVTAWADQSGKGNVASQTDESLTPVLVTNAINDLPVVRFDGTPRFLDFAVSPSLAITGDLSSFFVARFDDFAAFRAVWSQTTGNQPMPNDFYVSQGAGIPTFNRGGLAGIGGLAAAQAVPAGQYLILGFDAAGTNVAHYLNGATNGTGVITATPEDGGSPLRVGSRDDQGTEMKGDIAELLIFNQALSEADRTAVVKYLASKYAVAIVRVAPVSAAPRLTVERAGGESVTLSWPVSAAGFTLKSTGVLGTAVSWQTVATAPVVTNGLNQVTLPITGTQFFRLQK